MTRMDLSDTPTSPLHANSHAHAGPGAASERGLATPNPATHDLLAFVGACIPIVTTLLWCGSWWITRERAPGLLQAPEWVLLGAAAAHLLGSAVLAILIARTARGRAPIALLVPLAALPWLLGLAGALEHMGPASDPMRGGDSIYNAYVAFIGAHVAGTWLGMPLLLATGAGLSLAALAQRSPDRRSSGALLGFSAIPLLVVAGSTLASPLEGSAQAILAAMAAGVVLAMAGAATGASRPASGLLAVGAALCALLGAVAALSLAAATTQSVMIGHYSALSREEALVLVPHGVAEGHAFAVAARYAPLAALVPIGAIVVWVRRRMRPSKQELIALGAVLVVTLALLIASALSTPPETPVPYRAALSSEVQPAELAPTPVFVATVR